VRLAGKAFFDGGHVVLGLFEFHLYARKSLKKEEGEREGRKRGGRERGTSPGCSIPPGVLCGPHMGRTWAHTEACTGHTDQHPRHTTGRGENKNDAEQPLPPPQFPPSLPPYQRSSRAPCPHASSSHPPRCHGLLPLPAPSLSASHPSLLPHRQRPPPCS
jgi:hypothetical protein